MNTQAEHHKPEPRPDEASMPFFEGAKQRRLMLQRCSSCGVYMWPVKPWCVNCGSAGVEWAQASGKGTLYSFALMHQVYHPAFAEEVPYNIAEIDLAEGLRILSNIIGCSNADLQIGMPLEVTFEDISDEIALPKFRPAVGNDPHEQESK
jgi:uncharacterized OB-fold protein